MYEDDPKKELDLLQQIINILAPLAFDDRQRLLQTIATFFKIPLVIGNVKSQPAISTQFNRDLPEEVRTFSNHPDITPKQFLRDKYPRTDIERVACLAFYLTYYRETPRFKILDISKLNMEAAQVKFSNTNYAVLKATKAGYLKSTKRGNKQISALGERLVQVLPDRKQAILLKRKARTSMKKTEEDN